MLGRVHGVRVDRVRTATQDPLVPEPARAELALGDVTDLVGHLPLRPARADHPPRLHRVEDREREGREAGSEIAADLFQVGQIVDVIGTSKGKGFQGGIKRHNFRSQDWTHGNSVSHRVVGSTGQNQTPGRVFKGKKMPGQMGNKRVTVQGLEVISVDAEKGILVIKGAIPGANGGDVIVRPSVKA